MSEDAGLNDSAILLMSLGHDEAAEVLKYLSPKEVQKLGTAMSKLKGVTQDKIDEVVEKFHEAAGTQTTLGLDSDEYIRKALTKALGNEKAGFILDRILQGGDTSGIESLKWMDAPTVSELIRNEHPQIIASILVHLERDQAMGILNLFPERLRSDVILRVATLDGIQPNALRELNDVMGRVLSGSDKIKKTALGGPRAAAEMLNFAGAANEGAVIDAIKEYDPDLAQKVQDEMFVFENIMDIDDKGIQALLREVQSDTLILSMKGASPELREKIFKNMSSRAAETMREDLESRGPVKVAEVEAQQKEILKVVRKLAEEGTIVLGGQGDEAFL